MPPNDRLDRAPQIVVFRLALRPALLDKGRQKGPLLVRQNLHLVSHLPGRQMGMIFKN
jgi:hypothetical protein